MGSGASGKGSSRSQSSSSSTTTNTTVNQVDNRVYQSDFGAVEAGVGVARDAVDALADVSSDAVNLGREGLSAGTDNLNLGLGFAERVYGDSLQFGRAAIDAIGLNASDFADSLAAGQERALGTVEGVTESAFAAVGNTTDSAFETLGDFVSGLFGFTRDTVDAISKQATDLAGQSIAGNQSLAKATSESADDRVVRLGLYAFGAVAVILVLPAIFGKK